LDFQNLAKNGAVMEDLYGYQVSSLGVSQYPLLAIAAYIGNDVCAGSLESMTQPSDFYQQAIDGLTQLNGIVVPGTKVVLSGLVDGRILWDTLYNRIHPLGMTYENFYNFLTCTGANPCWTWLNSDGI
jgi:acyloxyacyl hydrolase